MKERTLALGIAAMLLGSAVTACSGGSVQSSLAPPIKTTVNPATQTALQFAVGTAMIAGKLGLNAVSTFRQSSGPYVGASVLTNAPTIAGPPGFTVPAAPDAYGDAGGSYNFSAGAGEGPGAETPCLRWIMASSSPTKPRRVERSPPSLGPQMAAHTPESIVSHTPLS